MKKVKLNSQMNSIACLTLMGVLLLCSSNLIFAKNETFKGTARAYITTTLPYGYNDDYRGIVQWTAMPGQILRGPIYDNNGKVVRPGNVIIQLDTTYRESIVKTKEDAIKIATSNLNWSTAQYNRYKKLAEKKAVSVQDFQEIENDYLGAVAALDSAKAELITAQNLYNLTTYRAQFDAIVDKVLMPCGLLAGEPKTIQLSQINPIAIEIKMPRELARKINTNTPIKVYPCGSSKPVGIMSGYHVYTDTGIKLFTDNYFIPKKGDPKLPVVKLVRPVVRLNLTNKTPRTLTIDQNSINKDDKGTFVWLAKNARSLQPGIGVNPVLELEKVYVKIGGYSHKIDNHWLYVSLANSGKLRQYDLLVEDPPKNAKTRDKVFWAKDKLLFIPGDPVKVEIDL